MKFICGISSQSRELVLVYICFCFLFFGCCSEPLSSKKVPWKFFIYASSKYFFHYLFQCLEPCKETWDLKKNHCQTFCEVCQSYFSVLYIIFAFTNVRSQLTKGELTNNKWHYAWHNIQNLSWFVNNEGRKRLTNRYVEIICSDTIIISVLILSLYI